MYFITIMVVEFGVGLFQKDLFIVAIIAIIRHRQKDPLQILIVVIKVIKVEIGFIQINPFLAVAVSIKVIMRRDLFHLLIIQNFQI